jgi:hypothetical protein
VATLKHVQETVLDQPVWQARQAAHEARVDGWLSGHLERQREALKHPVEDFLFTYYSFRPARLRRWGPGAGVILRNGPEPVDTKRILAKRSASIQRTRELLSNTRQRSGFFGCFGLHEWAMVYRQPPQQRRHNAWPLRLTPEHTAEVVERANVRCSHFDAYRFFTEPARPLNVLAPTRETQLELEQPACLHANMDLYKWSYKLAPLTPSELIADCFELARDIRTLDMQASPYDLAGLGFEPIRIETPEGRAHYAAAQRNFAERADPLRVQLINAIDRVLEAQ